MLLLSITAASWQGVGFHQTCSCSDASKLEFRFYSVEVIYPPGLEEMIGAFKFCATARLFLQVGTIHVCLRDYSLDIFSLISNHLTSLQGTKEKKCPSGEKDCSVPVHLSTKSCLYPQDMLPDVDAGIFLDNDMLVLQVPGTELF